MTSFLSATDLFAGAGGSSTGLVSLPGVEVLTAANHWKLALDSHAANHPKTKHIFGDLRKTHPSQFQRTTLLWASPECTKHSGAAGRKRAGIAWRTLWGDDHVDEEEERSRATMREVVEFAEYHRYELIIVENVTEIRYWAHYGEWLQAMQNLGYEYQEVYLNAMFCHPTPQSRDRIYVCFWRKGNKRPDLDIRPLAFCPKCGCDVESIWARKNPKSSKKEKALGGRVQYGKQYVYVCPKCITQVTPYYYAAANLIDWSIPAPKIKDRDKPLAANTLRRIKKGLEKYRGQYMVIDFCQRNPGAGVTSVAYPLPTQTTGQHFGVAFPGLIVDQSHPAHSADGGHVHSGFDPMPTLTGTKNHSVVLPQPFIVSQFGRDSAHKPITAELRTVTAFNDQHALIVPKPYIVMNMGNAVPQAVDAPLSTVLGSGIKHWIVTPQAFMVEAYGQSSSRGIDEPLSPVLGSHHHWLAMPEPFVAPYYGSDNAWSIDEALGTVETKARHGFVLPDDAWDLDECGYRMLTTEELKHAMAFPRDYVILGRDELRTKQIGNAVCPPVAQVLAERMFASLA